MTFTFTSVRISINHFKVIQPKKKEIWIMDSNCDELELTEELAEEIHPIYSLLIR